MEGGKGCFCCGRGISSCLLGSEQERPRPSNRSVLSGQRDTPQPRELQPLSEEQRRAASVRSSGLQDSCRTKLSTHPGAFLPSYFQPQHQFAKIFLNTFDVLKNTDLISGLYWSRAVTVRTENIQLFLFPYFRKLSQHNE